MQIELTGCTGAGKSTLAKRLLQACRAQGIDAWLRDDFVLHQLWLDWIKSHVARTLVVDLLSLLACLITWRKNLEFYLFVMRITWGLRKAVAWPEKLNLTRNILKKIGIYEIIYHRGSDQQVIWVDEGTLHAAHNLFVHVSVEPDPRDLSTFARLVPLPDMVIYVTQTEPVLIERTLARGHKRISERSYANTQRFIRRAVATFDQLMREIASARRQLMIETRQLVIAAQNVQAGPLDAQVLEIILAGVGNSAEENLGGIISAPGPSDLEITLISAQPKVLRVSGHD